MGALETFRRGDLREGDPLNWHPVNHKMAKDLRNRRGRGKESPKVERAIRNRILQEQFLQELPEMQFNRAFGHMADGTESDEDIDYVARNIHGQVIETFSIGTSNGNGKEKVTRVTIIIADFTRPVV